LERHGHRRARAVTRDDTAEIIFTSGATAEPKGVVITHRNVLANIVPVEREILKYRRYAWPFAPIRFLNLLPLLAHVRPVDGTFIPPMLAGTVLFIHGYNPHDIVRHIKARRISVLVSVPKILDVLREHILRVAPIAAEMPPAGEHFLRRWWRYRAVHRAFGWKFWSFVVGAAPLDPALEEVWGRLGYVVIQGYGLTETAPIVSLNHPFSTSKGSVGKAIAGVEVRIAPTARSSCAATTSRRATSIAMRRRPKRSKAAGSTRATSAKSTRRAGCSSRAGRRR
jgi:long-chain acyl-CoA synthetase